MSVGVGLGTLYGAKSIWKTPEFFFCFLSVSCFPVSPQLCVGSLLRHQPLLLPVAGAAGDQQCQKRNNQPNNKPNQSEDLLGPSLCSAHIKALSSMS